MPITFVTYNPTASNPAPVLQMGSGTAPNPVAVHTLTSTEQGYVQGNDPLSIVVDPSTGAVSSNPNFWTLRGAYYQSLQINLIKQAGAAANLSPLAFTNAAGVAALYPMDTLSVRNYQNAFLAYVEGGEALPSGFFFLNTLGVPVLMVLADVKNLYEAGVSRTQAYDAQVANLVGQVEAATSVSAVQAIVWVTP